MNNIIEMGSMVVTVLSLLSSLLNHVIRGKQSQGLEVPPILLGAGALLNVGAANIDKAVQLGKLLKTAKAADADAAAPAPRAE